MEQNNRKTRLSNQRVTWMTASVQSGWGIGGRSEAAEDQRQVDAHAAQDDHHRRPFDHEGETAQGETAQRVEIEAQSAHPREAQQDEINLHADTEEIFENEARANRPFPPPTRASPRRRSR